MRRTYIVLILIALVLLVGCTASTQTLNGQSTGQQTTTTGTTSAGASAITNANVEIKNFAFNPDAVTIKKGATVTWEQMDSAPHTATSTSAPAGAAFDSGTLKKGDAWSHTFDKEGTYEYYCAIHPNMKGKIIVE